jgi:hypothetical protein
MPGIAIAPTPIKKPAIPPIIPPTAVPSAASFSAEFSRVGLIVPSFATTDISFGLYPCSFSSSTALFASTSFSKTAMFTLAILIHLLSSFNYYPLI